ncbi:hypothetical protein A2Y85_07550 [candidate division WOR-3 bacterium RBG_13_43_14]|uniref:5'-Nucleotidase C-terminal domain-containing protein n=1 Tax=candidate division WOR-3 bacterium RBG_13_43_14 TaxID=1802590 RepID=A0A1F4U955_UNCW3|nr:MAG: hypothetical protein A2Y85_07550 [candidate division WOR-3 bacterium RBG_13_43_14]
MNPYYPPPLGNAAAAATVIKELRAEADSLGYGFLLFDSGDMFMGSPIGEFSKGIAVADYFNFCGYDVLSPGNHDYDLGVDVFKDFAQHVKARVVCSNIVNADNDETVDYLRPYEIIESNGIRIGIIGLLTEYMPGMTTPEKFKGHKVLEEIVSAREYIDTLQNHNIDLIFALTGIGLKHDKRLAENVPGIDVIIGSHSSTALETPYEDSINHTIIVQSYSHLTSIGFIDLWIDRDTRRIAGYRGKLIDLLSDEIENDPAMVDLVRKWEEMTQKGFDEIIGYSDHELTRAGFEESMIGNLITDAMREFFNVDIAIHNSGGIRANLPKGNITYRDCYNIDALSNTAVTMEVTGSLLKNIIEVGINGHHAIFQVSGIKYVYNSSHPSGKRLIRIWLPDNQLVENEKVYTIATNSYLAAGGGDYVVFKRGDNIQDTFHYLRNIIAEYIKVHSPIKGSVENRIIDQASNH